MRTPLRILCTALASLLLVAGCSATRTGEPTTDKPPATGETTTGRTDEPTRGPTPSEGPKRPKDIDIASLDPCALMNKVPVRKYGLDGRKPVGGTSSLFPGNKDCFSGGIDNNLGLTFVAVADKDAGDFVETANARVTEYDAEGYPLYVLQNQNARLTCFGVLDVHDGQFIWIAYGMGSPNQRPITPKTKLCQTVPMIAASTVSALG
ncbi:MAG TPA: DUF3558 domain-containing protein [Actinophytocola sp.]|jgi:hypothetical protein|uniref:DUF3558 domain-containing protein n=1 Tax=Actinophytocola sp. TaxID=1872138 RepID=UPI002F935278